MNWNFTETERSSLARVTFRRYYSITGVSGDHSKPSPFEFATGTQQAMPSWGQRTGALACCILLGVAGADHDNSTTGTGASISPLVDDWLSQCSTPESPTKVKVRRVFAGPAAAQLLCMWCPRAACASP